MPSDLARLFRAIEDDDIETISAIVTENPALINWRRDTSGMTPLHAAASKGSEAILDILLHAGGRVRERDGDGMTVLHRAIDSYSDEDDEGFTLVFRWAIDHAPSVLNMKNEDALTPLTYAIVTGKYGAADDLVNNGVEHGVNINVISHDSQTPLSLAMRIQARSGNNDVKRLSITLLRHGAIITPNVIREATPIYGPNALRYLQEMRRTAQYIRPPNNSRNVRSILSNRSPAPPNNVTSILSNGSPASRLGTQAVNSASAPTTCYDPMMAMNGEPITPEATTIYIMDEAGAIKSATCLDEGTLQQYKTMNEYMFFRCKDSVPPTALHISRSHVHPGAIRLLNLNMRVYVKDSQAQQLEVGKKYVVKPGAALGRIASHSVITTGHVVSGVHCGPADGSKLYELLEVVAATGGGRLRRLRLRPLRRTKRSVTRKRRHRSTRRRLQ